MEKKSLQNRNWLRSLLLIFFLAVFAYGAINLFGIWQEYREGENLYNGAQEEFLQSVENDDTLADARLSFAVDFDSLLAINKDVAGWVWMKDSKINYPILHSQKDNDEYLYTTYDGKTHKSGSIFIDYRNREGYVDDNTVLYGHNMKNGGMFAILTKMTKQEVYDAHKEFYIMTPEGNRRYEIISVARIDALSDLYDRQFDTTEAKQQWLNRIIKQSTVLAPFSASVDDTFVMLSTCVSGTDSRARVVAVGRLAEIEEIYQPTITDVIDETAELQ